MNCRDDSRKKLLSNQENEISTIIRYKFSIFNKPFKFMIIFFAILLIIIPGSFIVYKILCVCFPDLFLTSNELVQFFIVIFLDILLILLTIFLSYYISCDECSNPRSKAKIVLIRMFNEYRLIGVFAGFGFLILLVLYIVWQAISRNDTNLALISVNVLMFGITAYYAYSTNKILSSGEKERKTRRIQEISQLWLYPLLKQTRKFKETMENHKHFVFGIDNYYSKLYLSVSSDWNLEGSYKRISKDIVLNSKFNEFWFNIYYPEFVELTNQYSILVNGYSDYAKSIFKDICLKIPEVHKYINVQSNDEWSVKKEDILENINDRFPDLFNVLLCRNKDMSRSWAKGPEETFYKSVISEMDDLYNQDESVREALEEFDKKEREIIEILGNIESLIEKWLGEWENEYYISINNQSMSNLVLYKKHF